MSNYYNDISRFSNEGGAMQPVSPLKVEDIDEGNGPVVVGMALSALSGFFTALFLTWVF